MKDSTKKFWNSVLIFAAGATPGALVAYEIARHKYELSEDEQYFADLADELKEDEESTEEIKRTYNNIISFFKERG
jgi:membrane protein YqaA with SNARE-associated domain